MSENLERLCHAWLSCSESLTYKARIRLLSFYGSASKAYESFSAGDASLVGEKAWQELQLVKKTGLKKLEQALETTNIRLSSIQDKDYPSLLLQITDPPDLLFYQGILPEPDARFIAIVGSRRETRYGREQAFQIARGLATQGIIIVSGLARGIDTAAHEGALAAGGRTVGVLGSGIKRMYPKENVGLASRMISSGGVVISEFAPKAEPLAYRFPFRNRVVSGLSHGVLLIEARENSGTLITVGHALAQSREVFCLPGQVDSPGSIVPHRMLREGARLVTCADDILEDMGWAVKKGEQQIQMPILDLTEEQRRLYDSLRDEPQGFNHLSHLMGLDVAQLNVLLTQMEMDGLIETLPGKMFRQAIKY